MSCLVDISHAGTVLNPLSLFTLLTSIIPHTQVRPLLFRHDDFEFSLDLRPSLAVLTPEELKESTEHPSSFCHFQGGSPEGFKTWLSVCDPDQIEMVLHAPLATFTLDFEKGTFLFVPEEKEGSCDPLWRHSNKRGVKSKPFLHDQSLPSYYADFAHLFTRRRYIELAMVGEYSLFKSYNKNVKMTRNYMKAVVHMANSLYDSLNIEIRLVHLDIFTTPQVPEQVFAHAGSVLPWFKSYLKLRYKGVHYDTANLFLSRTVGEKNPTGVATKYTICHPENSFSPKTFVRDLDIAEKRRKSVRVASTLAHELGHNLGMEHDNKYDFLYCDCPLAHGCIMHGQSGEYKQYWSNCSLAYLDMLYKSGADYCLWNKPQRMIGSLLCGNGFVDPGEDCDCGQLGCVTHDCCDMTTCKFRDNARCASGSCCDLATCSLQASDVLCRRAETSCDVPEFCDGMNSECPTDTYRTNGDTCPEDKTAICFDGRCGSRDLQCKDIWGEKAVPAVEKCYDLNRHEFGCGMQTESSDMKCAAEDTLCGRLQCVPPKDVNVTKRRGWAEPFIWNGDAMGDKCTMMLAKYQAFYKPRHHLGMTLDGTRCGEGKYCLRSKCVHKVELLGCNLDHLYEESHCETKNECAKPNTTAQNDLYCTDDFGLQAELNTHKWVDISSADCVYGTFQVISRKRLMLSAVVGFRCIRKRIEQFYAANDCELGEDCAMPRNCTAMVCDSNWALQTKSEATAMVWTEAESVRCDSDKFVINQVSTEDQTQRFKCVQKKLCTTFSPLNSECRKNDAHCELWNPDSDPSATCASKMFHVHESRLPVEIANLRCNAHNGSWTADRKDNESQFVIPRGSNVYCHEGICDGSTFFPICEPNENCDTPVFFDNKFYCKDPFILWSRESEAKPWIEMENFRILECLAGYIIANGTRMSHGFQARCRKKGTTQAPPSHPTAEQNGPSAVVYIACSIVLFLIIITIIIITLKIAGRRTIEKIRGRKIRDSSTFSGSTSKTVTPSHKSPSVLSTRKE